jgi:NADH-ubiquinone oxidoreductase chain 4
MSNTLDSQNRMKKIALTTSLINFFISLFIWYQFDSSQTQYQFVSEFNQLNFCHLNFGIDGISLYFVLLTTFVTPVALLSNYTNITNNLKLFLISFLLLESLQICAFVSLDLLLFYIFFESVLPILFIVIVIFGHGNDRFRSAFLLFLYTLAGSLPMLLCILMINSYIGSTDFQLISLYSISLESQKILWLGFFIAFAVKTPLYPFIIWLPKAHGDSPIGGSIILAATIIKLATYGYLRVLINFLPDATHYFSPLVQTIAIITLVYASLSTIIQQDTKRLIAYSSICHMAVVILGLFSNTIVGIEGAILLSLAHGFVSPALFICVGSVIYDRTGTRIINYIRGLVTYMPVFTILFFIFILANTGIPLSLNFLGEQLSLIGIWQQNPIIACLGATGIVLSACYSLFLYNRLSYGNLSPHLPPLKDLNRREYFLLISLLVPTIAFGILPNSILTSLHFSVSNLLYTIPLITPCSVESGIVQGSEISDILLATSVLFTGSALPSNLDKKISNKYPETNCKDIVVWGTNLGLTIAAAKLLGLYSKQIREMIKLPSFQFSVVIGLYLSDGR